MGPITECVLKHDWCSYDATERERQGKDSKGLWMSNGKTDNFGTGFFLGGKEKADCKYSSTLLLKCT